VDDRDDSSYSRAPEPDDLVRLCRALNDAGARYILIGGFAVIAHGATRFTKDVDLLVDDAPDNIARVKQGLSVLADNAAAEVRDHDVRDHVVVRVADEIIVDLMGRACGLTYADVAADADTRVIDDVAIPIASPAMLIRTKDTFRPQDAIDRGFLEVLIKRRSALGLDRFTHAQEDSYDEALAEIRAGAKTGHWVWYILPQIAGLGSSAMSRRYAIADLDEAIAYLHHPVLGVRYRETVEAIVEALRRPGTSLDALMGSPIDATKLVSSLTLFREAAHALQANGAEAPADALVAVIDGILAVAASQGYPPCARTLASVGSNRTG